MTFLTWLALGGGIILGAFLALCAAAAWLLNGDWWA